METLRNLSVRKTAAAFVVFAWLLRFYYFPEISLLFLYWAGFAATHFLGSKKATPAAALPWVVASSLFLSPEWGLLFYPAMLGCSAAALERILRVEWATRSKGAPKLIARYQTTNPLVGTLFFGVLLPLVLPMQFLYSPFSVWEWTEPAAPGVLPVLGLVIALALDFAVIILSFVSKMRTREAVALPALFSASVTAHMTLDSMMGSFVTLISLVFPLSLAILGTRERGRERTPLRLLLLILLASLWAVAIWIFVIGMSGIGLDR